MKFIILVLLTHLALTTKRVYRIDINNFQPQVLGDKFVWVLLLSSEKCRKCQEFWPTFESTSERRTDFNFGIVLTDEKPGNDLAIQLGFQGQDLPAIVLYTERERYLKLLDGDVITDKQLDYMLFEGTRGLNRDHNGIFLKNIPEPTEPWDDEL
jgi:hypothetical protein